MEAVLHWAGCGGKTASDTGCTQNKVASTLRQAARQTQHTTRGDKNPGRLKIAEQAVAQAGAAVAQGEQALAQAGGVIDGQVSQHAAAAGLGAGIDAHHLGGNWLVAALDLQ